MFLRNSGAGLAPLVQLLGVASCLLCSSGAFAVQSSDHVLIKFKESVFSQSDRILAKHRLKSDKRLDRLGIHVAKIPVGQSPEALLKGLKQNPDIEFAELDQWLAPQGLTPNDPYYNQQWILWTMKTFDAWSITTGDPNLKIAYVDTGIDPNCFDMQTKIVPGINLYDSSGIWDLTGHGTQVAGMNATTNNGFGVAGVCWGCRILPIRVSDVNGNATLSLIASGITWAVDNGAKIINLGYAATNSATVQAAAQDARNRGVLVFAPAGNDDTTKTGTFDSSPDAPAIVTVGAVHEQLDTHKTWSNTGNNIDLVAGACAYTTGLSSFLTFACGTSYSSSIAAGVAGLVWSANPSLTPAGVEQVLKQSAVDLGTPGWDTTFGAGRLDALKAVQTASATPMSPCDLNGDGSTNVLDVQQEVNQALGVTSCTKDINNDGTCNVLDVQRVTNAALGGQCVSS